MEVKLELLLNGTDDGLDCDAVAVRGAFAVLWATIPGHKSWVAVTDGQNVAAADARTLTTGTPILQVQQG